VTVHLAIGRAWRAGLVPEQAVAQAASQTGLATHLADAAADVHRAGVALHALDIEPASCALEYPIAGLTARGALVAGYADLVAVQPDHLLVLDFKTDAPPSGLDDVLPRYVDQVRGYADALRRALPPQPIRAGLLYTADGAIRWPPLDDHETR
jgi:ATP-dependent helicase/nuclease subunit A